MVGGDYALQTWSSSNLPMYVLARQGTTRVPMAYHLIYVHCTSLSISGIKI